uniref:Lipocalin/cytosolic fatty-acid binding domain-containing protein n=1 Tax=Clastoptera arizonana TaxID=38151 RepID=A0A1B6DW06_9HEMI
MSPSQINMLLSIIFSLLIGGAYSIGYVSYDVVGKCKEIKYDDTFDFSTIPKVQYLSSYADVPLTEYLDGIVLTSVPDDSLNFSYKGTADVHTFDGKRVSSDYQSVVLNPGSLLERHTDDGVDKSYYMIMLGEVSQCKAYVYYRCSFQGTNPLDVVNVLKNDREPLTEECLARINEITSGRGLNLVPSRILPYKLHNYD